MTVVRYQAALPDGTFLILNGARQGNAGFGLATNPNLGAVLYDPSLPVNQRFSILANTIVARLYHSEATLLPDGRVLVSGSDPNGSTDPGPFPEEFRIEVINFTPVCELELTLPGWEKVYIPPYLTQGFRQPTFTITNTEWTYGGTFQISVQLFQGTTSNMRVSLIAGMSFALQSTGPLAHRRTAQPRRARMARSWGAARFSQRSRVHRTFARLQRLRR